MRRRAPPTAVLPAVARGESGAVQAPPGGGLGLGQRAAGRGGGSDSELCPDWDPATARGSPRSARPRPHQPPTAAQADGDQGGVPAHEDGEDGSGWRYWAGWAAADCGGPGSGCWCCCREDGGRQEIAGGEAGSLHAGDEGDTYSGCGVSDSGGSCSGDDSDSESGAALRLAPTGGASGNAARCGSAPAGSGVAMPAAAEGRGGKGGCDPSHPGQWDSDLEAAPTGEEWILPLLRDAPP
jgi:hypothetical protein